jgi:hypothetical protein
MSAFWTLFCLIIGSYIGIRDVANHKIFDYKKNKIDILNDRLSDFAMVLVTLINIVIVFISFYTDAINKYYSLNILMILLIILIYNWMLIKYIIKENTLYLSILFFGASFFMVNIGCSLMTDIEKMNRLKISDLNKYEFVFDREIKNDQKSMILLSANSSYFFFYDREKKKSIVIPKGSIKYIELMQK